MVTFTFANIQQQNFATYTLYIEEITSLKHGYRICGRFYMGHQSWTYDIFVGKDLLQDTLQNIVRKIRAADYHGVCHGFTEGFVKLGTILNSLQK